jgi:ArsR family transcriptional regulator
MELASRERYEARAKIARALSHPTRLMFLDALKQRGEMCVCDLTALAGADQSTVSKHLAILRDAGLVGVRKDGSMSLYSVKCQCLESFFGCIESVLKDNVKAQQALVAL